MGSEEAAKRQASRAAAAARQQATADAASESSEGTSAPRAEPTSVADDAAAPDRGGGWSLSGVTSWWARVPAIAAVAALISITVAGVAGSGGSEAPGDDDPFELFQTYVSNVEDEHLEVMREPSLSAEQVQAWWDHWSSEYGYEYDDIEEVIGFYLSDDLFAQADTNETDPRGQIAGDVAFAHAISQSGWFQADARTSDYNFAGTHPRHDSGTFEVYDAIDNGVRGHFYTLYEYYQDGDDWRDVVNAWTDDNGAYWDEVVSAVYGSMLEGVPGESTDDDGDSDDGDGDGDGDDTEGDQGEGEQTEGRQVHDIRVGTGDPDRGYFHSMLAIAGNEFSTSDTPHPGGISRTYAPTSGNSVYALTSGTIVDVEIDDCENAFALMSAYDAGIRYVYCGVDELIYELGDDIGADVIGSMSHDTEDRLWVGLQVRSGSTIRQENWAWYCIDPVVDAISDRVEDELVSVYEGSCSVNSPDPNLIP